MLVIDKGPIRPQLFGYLFPRNQFARARKQNQEHLERLDVHLDPQTLLPKLASRCICLKHSEAIAHI